MSNEFIQAELDLAEEHILTCLFKDAHNPQVGGVTATFLTLQGKSLAPLLNSTILKAEAYIKPWLKDNGYVDGTKVALYIKNKFNKDVTIPDFRMIEFTRSIEPMLQFCGKYLQ